MLVIILVSCSNPKPKDNFEVAIPSPNGNLHLNFNLHNGEPYYLVYLDDEIVVGWSLLGFTNGKSETFSENMLLTKVGPLSADKEDIQTILTGEKYNSLKISLQKQKESGKQYDVVFLIYNETIVYWYEYDYEFNKLNVQENTELDLNSKNQKWKLTDSNSIADTLFLPVTFESDKDIRLTYSEFGVKKNAPGYLLQKKQNLPEFSIITPKTEVIREKANTGLKIKTTLRSIYIQRNY
jgi:alpha-glucosidase